jgi:hypothetical protein
LLGKKLSPEETEKLRSELEFIYKDKEEMGIAETLKDLRERGVFNLKNADFSGRNLDKNPYEEGLDAQENDRIKLEYRDETGRLMTKK